MTNTFLLSALFACWILMICGHRLVKHNIKVHRKEKASLPIGRQRLYACPCCCTPCAFLPHCGVV